MMYSFIKRFLDFIISLIFIIILSPLFLIVAFSVKITSKGNVFFKQKRIGLRGKVFYIYKFRTMVDDAEHIGSGLHIDDENDPRITKVGKILRATSIDEIPQLINCLLGNMSLVGPRPPATYYPYDGYNNYPEWALKRFQVKPGITGLAQVEVRNSVTWDERFLIDNNYVDNMSILLDVKIIFMTIKCIFNQNHLYKNDSE